MNRLEMAKQLNKSVLNLSKLPDTDEKVLKAVKLEREIEELSHDINFGKGCEAEPVGWYGKYGHYCCEECHEADDLLSSIPSEEDGNAKT